MKDLSFKAPNFPSFKRVREEDTDNECAFSTGSLINFPLSVPLPKISPHFNWKQVSGCNTRILSSGITFLRCFVGKNGGTGGRSVVCCPPSMSGPRGSEKRQAPRPGPSPGTESALQTGNASLEGDSQEEGKNM